MIKDMALYLIKMSESMIPYMVLYLIKRFESMISYRIWFRKTRGRLSFHIKSVTILGVTATVMLGICLGTIG